MTEYIIGERRSGKTTELIKRSAETGAVILAPTRAQASCIYDLAKELGYGISGPITVSDLDNDDLCNIIREKGILIDELDYTLVRLCKNIPVTAATITNSGKKNECKVRFLLQENDRKDENGNSEETDKKPLKVKDVISASETRYVYLYVGDDFITKIKPSDALSYLSADILESSIVKIDTENSMVRITIAGKEK